MFRSVLVPLDGSPFSEQALPLAQMVGRVSGTKLHLGHVHDGDGRDQKESYLEKLVESLKEAGVDADQTLMTGKVTKAIEDWATRVKPDLILMATHGRSGVERLRLGSVAEVLVSRGLAPMLLLHASADGESPAPGKFNHVVVALDQSSFAQSILEPLASLGKAAGVSAYTLVHVAENKGAGRAGWTPLAAVQARALENLDPIRARLQEPDVSVDVQVVMSADPSAGILGVAEKVGADIIAMTTHGMTGVRPTLLGSVASKVLHDWHGPLLIHRPS
ncbi:MAG: universal stress protein [Gemmatimonadota bacterium]|nr:universal stress protein [Gemmatimonadota bacterium]MDH3422354.1 universal stress protein [Gemmatimonadota bacterium]